MARVELVEVVKRYPGHVALDHVSLDIASGSFVALVGASGSGKTTLLKTINRLIEPDAGAIRLDGADAGALAIAELRRRIGYVLQGVGLFPHMTVAENIAIAPRLAGVAEPARRERVGELLRLTALDEALADRYPRELSGGQAQRVGVARALATRPALMLMDEPFGALDPVTRDALGQAYRALHDELGLTTIMVTHDTTEALLLADRIVVLDRGRVRGDDAPGALLGDADPLVAELVGVPRRQAERLAAIRRS